MKSNSRLFGLYGLVTLSILVLASLGWVNYRFASQNKGGRSFLVNWMGARTLILAGENPYSEPVAVEIRQVLQDRFGDPTHFSRVTFPLYAILYFLPFALFQDLALAQALWMLVLELFLALLILACLRLSNWRPNNWNLPVYLLFVVTWFHSVVVIQDGSTALLVALLLAWSFLAIRNGQDELAGVLLALSTTRPLLVLLPVLFVLLWAIVQKRGKLLVWFSGFLVLLVFGSMFFLQDWLLQYIRAGLAALRESPYPMTPGEAFRLWIPGIGSRLGWTLTALLTLILIIEWWLAISRKEFRWFLWTVSLTLVLGQWIGIRTGPENYIILLIPLTLVFSIWDERWRQSEQRVRAVVTTVASVLLLGPGIWGIYWIAGRQVQGLAQMPVLLFPLPLYLIVAMYWVRWWAIRPQRLYVEALREVENS